MMNKMTEEEGAACMHNVQHKHGLPRHTPPPSPPMGGVAQEREEGGEREKRERQLLPSITC